MVDLSLWATVSGAHVEKLKAHLVQLLLQYRQHGLLDQEVCLVEILDDNVVGAAVDVQDDGLDGRLDRDEDA